MNNERWNSAFKMMLFVALVGTQDFVNAGRMDFSVDSAESAKGLDKGPAAKEREQPRVAIVHDGSCSEPMMGSAADAQLADYLEMHGRVVEGSIRSTMMPWSALQQVAN